MALAVSSLTSLTLLSGEQFKLRILFQRHSRKCWTNSGFFSSSARRRGVCVVGSSSSGGYGVVSESESQRSSYFWPDSKKVVLVDQSEHFVFKPLLYELLSGEVDEWEIAPRFSDLLSSTAVQFFKDGAIFTSL